LLIEELNVNIMRFVCFLLATVGALTNNLAFSDPSIAPTISNLSGVWEVVDDSDKSKAIQTLRAIALQPNGDATLRFSNMSFKRRWKVSSSVLTIYAAKEEFAPGPPDDYRILDLDMSKKQLLLRNELLRQDLRLVKTQ